MTKLTHKEITTTTKIITSENDSKTFSITRCVPELEGMHAIFVLLYPTRNGGNCFIDDSTNTHLMTHMEELGFKSYTIVNLFASVTQSRLSLRGLQIDEENLIFLKEQIFLKLQGNKEKVVIAWGNSHLNSPVVSKSKQRILELWEETQPGSTLYQLTAEGMQKDNTAVHPLFLGIRYSNSVWKLKTYPHKKFLKELVSFEKQKQQKQQAKNLREGR